MGCFGKTGSETGSSNRHQTRTLTTSDAQSQSTKRMTMAYRLPTWIVPCQIYNNGGGPPAAPRLIIVGNLTPGWREMEPLPLVYPLKTLTPPVFLLCPKLTDIRGGNSLGGGDVVQCPSNSGRIYDVLWVEDSAKGFQNEHRIAVLVQRSPMLLDGQGVPQLPPPPPPPPPPMAPQTFRIAPATGPIAGGTPVVIQGVQFTGTTQVTFGGTLATSVVVLNDSQLTCVTPAHVVGYYDVIVTNGVGSSPAWSGDLFNFFAPVGTYPVVTSVLPAAGPTAGLTPVTIRGSGFTAATAVTFGGLATGYSVVSDTEVSAISPAHSAGPVDVQVTTSAGQSFVAPADEYTYGGGPEITALGCVVGLTTGGTAVAIKGTGFSAAVDGVFFGGRPALHYFFVAPDVLATAPPGAGTVDVRVSVAGQLSPVVPADQFTYQGLPVVSSLSVSTGPATGGTAVTLTGSGFTGCEAVCFTDTGAVFVTNMTVVSDTQIDAVSPPGPTGVGHIWIQTCCGRSAFAPANVWTYTGAGAANALDFGPTGGGIGYAAGDDTGLPTGNATITVTCWVELDAAPPQAVNPFRYGTGGGIFSLETDGAGNWRFNDGAGHTLNFGAQAAGKHLLALKYDGTVLSAQIDNGSISTLTFTMGTSLGGAGALAIGDAKGIAAQDCRLYTSALTSAQLTAIWNGGTQSLSAGPPAQHWWKLNEGSGLIAHDTGTTGGNDLTAVSSGGYPVWVTI
jgi:IPT/TIG domain